MLIVVVCRNGVPDCRTQKKGYRSPQPMHGIIVTNPAAHHQCSLERSHSINVPSGKLTFCYGKSPFLMGKSTINGPFSIAFC